MDLPSPSLLLHNKLELSVSAVVLFNKSMIYFIFILPELVFIWLQWTVLGLYIDNVNAAERQIR